MKPRGEQFNLNKFDIYNGKVPVLVSQADIRVGKDGLASSLLHTNNINSYVRHPVNGITYLMLTSTGGGGIIVDDPNLELIWLGGSPGLYGSTTITGIPYTGDPIPTVSSYGIPLIHPVSSLLYYASVAATTDFYVFDVFTAVNTKKPMGGSYQIRKIAYDAINDKVVIACIDRIIVHDVAGNTLTHYTSASANYTGDLLPATGMAFSDVSGDSVYVGTSGGLYKFNLTTLVCTKYTTANGLASNSTTYINAYNGYVYFGQSTAATPLGRISSAGVITLYGAATANYSGDKLPSGNLTLFLKDSGTGGGVLHIRYSSKPMIVIIDQATNALTAYDQINIGLDVATTNFALMDAAFFAPNYTLKFTGSDIGVQEMQLSMTSNPLKLSFNENGLKYVSPSTRYIGTNDVVYRGYVDTSLNNLKSEILGNEYIGVNVSGTDAYTGSASKVHTFTYQPGKYYILQNINANTIPNPTININGIGVVNITDYKGGPLTIGVFTGTVIIVWEGTQFRMVGGGGGHAIEGNGVLQTTRNKLNFIGLTVTDDLANDATKIELATKTINGVSIIGTGNIAITMFDRRTYYRFNSNLFTEQALSFRGLISAMSTYFTAELSAISFEVRLDTASVWTAQADLTALQAWINTNVTGTEATGTVYWIKVLATYGAGKTGEAEVRLSYTAS